MPSRAQLELRAAAIGLDYRAVKYSNDSVLEQATLQAEKAKTATTATTNATATITSNGTAPTSGDTVTIAGKTYTFLTALTNTVPNEVLIGGTAAAALTNLKAAIQFGMVGVGTQYSTQTQPNQEVQGGTLSATVLQLVATKQSGADGNSIGISKVAATLTLSGATLTGGVTTTGPTPSAIAAESGNANV